MARGYEANQQRKQALAALGRALARRSSSKCEVCEASGVSLAPWEVPPVGETPELERTILLCERCRWGSEGGPIEPNDWRFLDVAAWSPLPAAQVTAVRMLQRLADDGADWAQSALDGLYLAPEVEAWVREAG